MYENAVHTIDLYHQAIHDGWMFCLPGKISALAAGASHVISFKTGAKSVHFKPMRVGSVANVVETRVSEDSTITNGSGSAVTPLNRNRNGSLKSVTTVVAGAAMTAEGTIIDYMLSGSAGTAASGRSGGAGASSNDEIVMKPNTQYAIRVANIGSTTATDVYYEFVWYEPTD